MKHGWRGLHSYTWNQSLQANYSINLSLGDGTCLVYTMVLVVLMMRQWRYSMNWNSRFKVVKVITGFIWLSAIVNFYITLQLVGFLWKFMAVLLNSNWCLNLWHYLRQKNTTLFLSLQQKKSLEEIRSDTNCKLGGNSDPILSTYLDTCLHVVSNTKSA